MAALDYVCCVWLRPEARWCCAAVSRHFHRVEVVAHAVILGGGHALPVSVAAGDVEAAEAAAAALPAPEESVLDVLAQAIRDGRPVSVDLPDIEVN